MKKATLVFCAALVFVLAGCCETPHYGYTVYSTYPPYEPAWTPPPSIWARTYRRLWNDGYSFSNDPRDPDVLAPVLGIDIQFPPAPLPYKAIGTP